MIMRSVQIAELPEVTIPGVKAQSKWTTGKVYRADRVGRVGGQTQCRDPQKADRYDSVCPRLARYVKPPRQAPY
jgi:hypothetical protein